MDKKDTFQLNNKGLSLVELIIAISIGVIVAGSIAALMTFAIRMYRNESVNTEMQYELQTNINLMMDEIMGASYFVVEQNSGAVITATGTPYTKYAMFGKLQKGVTLGVGGTGQRFEGVIFVSSAVDSSGKFKVLMNRFSVEDTSLDLKTVATNQYSTVYGASDPTVYLLGENVTQFVIEPDPEGSSLDKTVTPRTYTNPIPFKVELRFERNGWGTKVYNRHVDDMTYLRNRVSDTVYIKGPSDSALVPYEMFEKD